MSAAFPEVTPQHSSVSPLLAEAVHENLLYFAKISKIVIELTQKVASIHEEAALSLMSTVDLFNKKIADVNKAKPQCQSESFVKFIHRILEQFGNQAKMLQSLGTSFADCVVSPLNEAVEKKKEVWKTCFHYVESFQYQIRKKEEDLVKRYKDYSDVDLKVKSKSTGEVKKKQLQMFHNSHNTYLLRLSSVNSINNLLYTHVLPHVLHIIEKNHCEMNDSLRHHMKYMFSAQKETLKKLGKSVDKIDHVTDKIDLMSDLKKFTKIVLKSGLRDKNPPRHEFMMPKLDQGRRASVAAGIMEEVFVVDKFTQPNLQRRLASLQHQTSNLVDSISTMRAGESVDNELRNQENDPSLYEVIELLGICDKEANLNVLLKQMELYTPTVIDFLGPAPEKLMEERKHTRKSMVHRTTSASFSGLTSENGPQPHSFIEQRLTMKPISCYYCGKLVVLIGKGFMCKVCKMSVHKKCATNVPFCGGTVIKQKLRTKSSFDLSSGTSTEGSVESSVVFDLIDLECDDDDYDYFDEDEFDDGLSDEEELQDQTPALKPVFTTPKPQAVSKAIKPAIIAKPLPLEPGISKHYRTSVPTSHSNAPPLLPPRRVSQVTSPDSKQAVKPAVAKKPSLPKKPPIYSEGNQAKNSDLCVSLYDFRGTKSSDLSFMSGCKIELLDKTNSDWWQGRCNGFEGYFPSQYVLEINENDRVLRSLYAFTAQNSKELTVEEGQILVLLYEEDDWLMVQSSEGNGLIPSSYSEYI